MNFRHLKIRTRLIIGFSIVVVLSVLIGYSSLKHIQKASNTLEKMYLHPLAVSNAVRDINTNIVSIHRSMKDVALATSDAEINDIEGRISAYEKEVYKLYDLVFERFLGDKKDIRTSFELFKQWKPIREEVIALWYVNNKEAAALITKRKGAIHVNKILASVDVMIEFANIKGDEFYTLAQTNERNAYNSLSYLLFATILASIITALFVSKYILKTQKRVKKSERYLHNIINNIGDPFFVKDEQSRLLLVNDSFCEMFKLSIDDIIGKTLAEEVSSEEREIFMKIDNQVLSSGEENISEELLTIRDDKTLTISTRKTRFIDSDGKKYLIGIIHDISKDKQIQVELNLAKERAEESDRLKSAFLANMSHEIRTPMNGILGFASLLKKPNLTGEEQKEYLKIIEKSGTRMLGIINDIVNISKIESGLMELEMNKSNINEQIEYIYTFFKPEVEDKGMLLSYNNSLTSKESFIVTDREKLYAVLTNLVKNAIKYSDKGAIELGYLKKGDYLEFYVKDTGIGIKKANQIIIFERFIQTDITKSRFVEGNGLGLSISKAYVKMLGGEIWVESEVGKGSAFYFTIPYRAQKSHDNLIEEEVFDKANLIENRKLKILIVEDDEVSEMLISFIVKDLSSHIINARTGNEAVVAFKENLDIDVILMDIQLPEINGYEATRQIREIDKNVIIIAQTAFGLNGDREKAINAGCNDYIVKPINENELNRIIVKHL